MKVVLYTQPKCAHCETVKAILKGVSKAFVEVNVKASPKAQKQLMRQGLRGVPQLQVGGEFILPLTKKTIRDAIT